MNSSANLAPSPAEINADRGPREVPTSSAPAATVRIARSFAEVEEFRATWSSWPSHRDSDIDFCLEFGWTRQEVVRPHVIVLYREGRPEAMLVGWIELSRLKTKIGYLRLPGMPARVLSFSYGGLLGSPSAENCHEIIRSVLDSLRRGEADVAIMDHLRVGSPLYEEALRSAGVATRDHVVKSEPHSVMVLPASVDELYRRFSQGLRAEVRRKKKKILADFGESAAIRCYRQVQEIEEVVPLLENVAKGTYQRGLGVGFRDTEKMRERLRFCARKGWLRIYVLTISDKPCAFWVGTLSNESFLSDYNSYDPQYRDYSLGTYLLITVVEQFCEEGVKNIDFGFGPAEYKERFGNALLLETSVCIFAPSIKGFVLNTIRTTTCSIDAAARKVLDRTNLLPRIKRFWRKRATKVSPSAPS